MYNQSSDLAKAPLVSWKTQLSQKKIKFRCANHLLDLMNKPLRVMTECKTEIGMFSHFRFRMNLYVSFSFSELCSKEQLEGSGSFHYQLFSLLLNDSKAVVFTLYLLVFENEICCQETKKLKKKGYYKY